MLKNYVKTHEFSELKALVERLDFLFYEAIQDLNRKISSLEGRIQSLEGKRVGGRVEVPENNMERSEFDGVR